MHNLPEENGLFCLSAVISSPKLSRQGWGLVSPYSIHVGVLTASSNVGNHNCYRFMGWLLKKRLNIILNGVCVYACTCALVCAYVHMTCTHSGPQMPTEDAKPCNWSDMSYLVGSWELSWSPLEEQCLLWTAGLPRQAPGWLFLMPPFPLCEMETDTVPVRLECQTNVWSVLSNHNVPFIRLLIIHVWHHTTTCVNTSISSVMAMISYYWGMHTFSFTLGCL